jgi:sugar lactone lactonase YvrE
MVRDSAGEDAASGGLRLIHGPVGSEDIVQVPGTPWLIASGLNLGAPAQFSLIDTRSKAATRLLLDCRPGAEGDDGAPPPEFSSMSTDGLALRSLAANRHLLFAANHGDRHAIEIFAVEAGHEVPTVHWVGCALLPRTALPNAVRPLSDGRLLIICPYDPTDPDSWSKMARGAPTGKILTWERGHGVGVLPNSAMSGGNGLEISADGALVYASAWSARELVVLSLRRGTRHAIAVDFLPDNIHALADGTLLVAGQCSTVEAIAACGAESCPQPWAVARVYPQSGEVRRVFSAEGSVNVNYACGALVAGDALYFTVRGDRCIVYKPRNELPALD